MMSGIRGKNTKPEIQVRHGLFAEGLRYRLHDKRLPGNPDIVLPKHHAVVFVHGCFWHCHNCSLFRWPKSNTEFWLKKLNRNRKADEVSEMRLSEIGWRIAIVWECALKGGGALDPVVVTKTLCQWITSTREALVITGKVSTSE